jgi:hypothetical protein
MGEAAVEKHGRPALTRTESSPAYGSGMLREFTRRRRSK